MAAIGPKIALATAAIVLFYGRPIRADQPADVLAAVNHVATALTNEDSPDAISVFSKSCKDYATLSGYFDGLTSRALLWNEVDVTDETDAESETNLTVQWTITLNDKVTNNQLERRSESLHIRLIREKDKWKIVELTPIDLFDPAVKPKSK